MKIRAAVICSYYESQKKMLGEERPKGGERVEAVSLLSASCGLCQNDLKQSRRLTVTCCHFLLLLLLPLSRLWPTNQTLELF